MDNKIRVSSGACILLAAMVLFLPFRWVAAAALAAAVHEMGHWFAIWLFTGRKPQLRLFAFGGRIPLPPIPRSKELLCAVAGPLGGLLLLPMARWLPRTAICAAFQSMYNLLPVYPLDGGRILDCLCALLFPPPAAKTACTFVQGFCILGISLLGIYGSFILHLGLLPILFSIHILIRLFFGKMPCKVAPLRVQ